MKFATVFDILRKFFIRTFTCFSLITLFFALFGLLLKTDELYKYMPVKNMFVFLAFSACFALSFLIADFIKNNIVIKRTVQFVLTFASLVGVFFLGGSFGNYVKTNGIQNKGFSVLAICFAFVVIYAVCALIVVLAGAVYRRLASGNEEYENVYKNSINQK